MALPTPTPTLPDARREPIARGNHNRDLALQQYLRLQEQHESLRQHLSELRPLQTPVSAVSASPVISLARTSSTSSVTSLGAPSPTSRSHRLSIPSGLPWGALESVLDETALDELATKEAKLCHVNEGIKRTLTELLNCETVRDDRAFRTWVQCRLMDTERELRSGRRRRSAPEP
ncbi:hypothetical protein B0T18DRAFT_313632 [Schizothecium vesticola]|uniref:Uncharacterized protein n=1 Tax=Schizothecium vesticola TaxID=314040 RepID=A0AA40FCF4_9PEZI|nr:hypothetical protein B0T18DRAFT_313632 [Schizothecium vesticola]